MEDRSQENIQQGEMPNSPIEKEAHNVRVKQHYLNRQREATLHKSTQEDDSNLGI